MTSQELINIAGVASIQTLINVELTKARYGNRVIKIDGMFGPKTLAELNFIIEVRWLEGLIPSGAELNLPPLPETGYWENGIEIFQTWYNLVYHKYLEWKGTVPFRKPQKDGKWGDNTYKCLVSLLERCNRGGWPGTTEETRY